MTKKKLERMTVEELRTRYVLPISELALAVQKDVERFAAAVRDGSVPHPHLEMNVQQGDGWLKKLRGFFTKELSNKLNSVMEGTFRYRLVEKKHKATKKRGAKSKIRAAE